MEYYDISCHNYAKDIQFYITVLPCDYSPIEQINEWICQIFKEPETEIIETKEERLSQCSVWIRSSRIYKIKPKPWCSYGLCPKFQVNYKISLLPLAWIKGFQSTQDTEKLVPAFIFNRLDYCNGVLINQPDSCNSFSMLLPESSFTPRKWSTLHCSLNHHTGFLYVKG